MQAAERKGRFARVWPLVFVLVTAPVNVSSSRKLQATSQEPKTRNPKPETCAEFEDVSVCLLERPVQIPGAILRPPPPPWARAIAAMLTRAAAMLPRGNGTFAA